MHTPSIVSPTHHFPEVPVSLWGGGGVLHFYHHFPEVKFLCVWGGGGGCTFIIRNGGGGGVTILSPMWKVFEVPYFHIFHLLPRGEKPDGGCRVERWGSPPAKLTLLLFTYLVHACGHGLQRKQGAELGKRKGGGASLIWGARHKSDIGGWGRRSIMGRLGGWGLGGMVQKSLKSEI